MWYRHRIEHCSVSEKKENSDESYNTDAPVGIMLSKIASHKRTNIV